MPVKSTKADRLMSAICQNQAFAKKVGISTKGSVNEGSKPSFTTYLIADRMLAVLSETEIDAFIHDLDTGNHVTEAKKAKVSDKAASAVYHRDYIRRKKDKKKK